MTGPRISSELDSKEMASQAACNATRVNYGQYLERGKVMPDMWHIVAQSQDTVLSDTGPGFETVWEVTYQVDSGPAVGTKGKVRIPVGQYNAELVKNTVDAAVYHLDQIAGL